jgi:hypothetical protein
MKTRIRKNTIRFRLDKMDIENLDQKGSCGDKIDISPLNLTFTLNVSENERVVSESSSPDYAGLQLGIPCALITPVIDGSQVGFECQVAGTGDSVIDILIERDFKCLTEDRGEEDAHAFDHPLADS